MLAFFGSQSTKFQGSYGYHLLLLLLLLSFYESPKHLTIPTRTLSLQPVQVNHAVYRYLGILCTLYTHLTKCIKYVPATRGGQSNARVISYNSIFYYYYYNCIIRRGATTVTFGWPDIKRAAERVYWQVHGKHIPNIT